MKKQKFISGMAAVLTVCMNVSALPVSAISSQVFAIDDLVEFTDKTDRGKWDKTSGNGSISFQDGQGDNGFMTVKSNGDTIFADTSTTKRADGFVEMDMKMTEAPTGARMAIIFRYNSPTDWEGIGIDHGDWTWLKGSDKWGSVSSTKKIFTSVGEKHHLRVEYRGSNLKVFVDGEQVINQDIKELNGAKEGNIGIRLWGDIQENFDGHCAFQVDNVTTGDLQVEAGISPDNVTIPYEEAGKEDVVFTMTEVSPNLKMIKNGDVSLIQGKDYTIDGTNVILSKTYVESLKETAVTDLTFVFEDEQEKTCHLFIEKQEEVVSYIRNFKEGKDGFEKVLGSGSLQVNKDSVTIQGDGVFVDKNSKILKNQEVEFTYDPINNNCNYGVILRYTSPSEYIYVGPSGQNAQHYTKWGIYGPNGLIQEIEDSGFILEGREVPYNVKVRLVDNIITIYVDKEEIWNGTIDGITMKPGKTGFRTTNNAGMTIQGFTQETAVKYKKAANVTSKQIQSNEMSVKMDTAFPRVEEYTLTTGEKVKGQKIALHQVEINNKLYTPKVTSEINGNKAMYHMNIDELKLSFDVIFTVEKNVLSMDVENIKESDTKLYTLNFPRHSLISMSSKDPSAQLRVNNYKEEKRINLKDAKPFEHYNETTLTVLSNDNVAAAISGESYKNRHEMAYQTFALGDHTSTGIWVNEYTYRGLDGELYRKHYSDEQKNEPWARVAITTDCNKDSKVDYQDGAIVLRDDCMERKTGADTITDSWNMIAMNVGSEAQYPFLRILDNAKKMSLATDNFSQNIIIKGYQSEGHDASHPDFANYNKRAGGLEDFKTLLEESQNYNTKVGVHINHTDVYPEAPQYEKIKTELGAWSWYDSAKQIVRENDDLDKTSQGLDGRLEQLFDKDTENMLDTVYVDVFFGTRWPMYKLVDNINSRDMALGTEYVDEMVSHSVFAHHIGSNFGGAGNLVRIVDNSQADIFANHQLFRGAASRANEDIGIDGWQGAKDMNKAIQSFYEKILPNKFLAQYPIMQYSSDEKAVLGNKNEVVTKMENGKNIITLNEKAVAKGNQIFIPWENEDKEKEGKIYHWNPEGGTTTWELPDSWSNVTTVKLYELSDEGKKEVTSEVIQKDGNRVTINAKAKTGYVLYKDKVAQKDMKTADTMEWSSGSPVKDMGFDSHNFDEWKPSSSAENTDHITIENNEIGNSHLYIKGENDGKVTQTLTGLIPGQTYAASVWCITDDGRKASIEVQNGDEVAVNYMNRSNVTYGVHHNDKYKTKAQRMQVRFTALSDSATLTLSAAKGKDAQSIVDFDDVRVVKVDPSTNPDPKKYTYWEDFENTDQGWGAFISTESDQSHLSQKNPVNPEVTDDVIDGNYSLKVRAGDYMRTIPSTVRLEPETEYKIGISYKSPAANAFIFAVKSDKAKEANDEAHAVIASIDAIDKEGNLELKFTTGNYDDYYIDITKKAGSEYYLDNFYVQAARPINRETLGQLIQEAKQLEERAYTPESYAKVVEAINKASKVLDDAQASKEEIRDAYKGLEAAIEQLVPYALTEEKASLMEIVTTMKSLHATDYKQDDKWMKLQTLIKEAEALYKNDKATSVQVSDMIRDLNDAKDALNPVVDRSALKEIMKKAERVDRNAVVDGAELQTFLSAIENAKAVDIKPGVTEEEIASATKKLQDAYNMILLKEDMKNQMVNEALKKADVKEEYYLEEDWKAITEAKTALQEMSTQTNVKVADYYEVLDKLETALNNKLNRPVISSSIEIDSSAFDIKSNNEQPQTGNEGPIALAFDQNPNTLWHSKYEPKVPVTAQNPAQITIDMKNVYTVNQFSYLQRLTGDNGKIKKFNLYVKNNESDDWTKIVADGTFKNVNEVQKVKFEPVQAQYVMFEVTEGIGNFASAAELAVYEQASDFSNLQKAMSEFEKKDPKQYTTASYTAVKKVYDEAVAMLDNPLTEQKKIDDITGKLKQAITSLELLATGTDIQMLENAIEEAKKIDLTEYKDTKAFEAALKEALDVQKDMQDGKEVTQKEVTSAALALVEEMNNLVPVDKPSVDYSKLQEEIDSAIHDSQASKYPVQLWDAYQNALNHAKTVLSKADATQEEVDNALKQLQDTRKALEDSLKDDGSIPSTPIEPGKPIVVPEPPKNPEEGQNETDTSEKTDKEENESSIKTGVRSNTAILGITTIAALGAMVELIRKKRKN